MASGISTLCLFMVIVLTKLNFIKVLISHPFIFLQGLNVYSMLKHSTLVLTLAAVERIEERILFHLNRNDAAQAASKYRLDNF